MQEVCIIYKKILILSLILVFFNSFYFKIRAEPLKIEATKLPVRSVEKNNVRGGVPWGTSGLTLVLDTDGTLHIPAGNVTNPLPLYQTISQSSIKKIVVDGPLVLSGNISSLFAQLAVTTSILGLNNINTANVTRMDSVFNSSISLISLDLSNWNTSNVQYMGSAFYNCASLLSLNLQSWDTSRVLSAEFMFHASNQLKSLKIGPSFKFKPLPNLTTPTGAIYSGKWQNVGSGTESKPNGSNIWTTSEFVNNYNGVTNSDTYVWQPNPPALPVTIQYLDKNNAPIHANLQINGIIGELYDATTPDYKLTIPGYTLDASKLPINGKGSLSNLAQTVTYHYTGNSKITIKSLDKDTNASIATDQVVLGTPGESLNVTPPTVTDFVFSDAAPSLSLTFTEADQIVSLYYYKRELRFINVPSVMDFGNVKIGNTVRETFATVSNAAGVSIRDTRSGGNWSLSVKQSQELIDPLTSKKIQNIFFKNGASENQLSTSSFLTIYNGQSDNVTFNKHIFWGTNQGFFTKIRPSDYVGHYQGKVEWLLSDTP